MPFSCIMCDNKKRWKKIVHAEYQNIAEFFFTVTRSYTVVKTWKIFQEGNLYHICNLCKINVIIRAIIQKNIGYNFIKILFFSAIITHI